MKITNDLNNNSDFLSVSNKGDEDTSLLGSLFSINFNSNEVKSNNISDDFEFIFREEDIEIINYLSIEKGFSSPDTPPNKLFPKLSVMFAMSNISFFSLSTSLTNRSLSFLDRISLPLSTAIS